MDGMVWEMEDEQTPFKLIRLMVSSFWGVKLFASFPVPSFEEWFPRKSKQEIYTT